jgi:hypothetical protein
MNADYSTHPTENTVDAAGRTFDRDLGSLGDASFPFATQPFAGVSLGCEAMPKVVSNSFIAHILSMRDSRWRCGT